MSDRVGQQLGNYRLLNLIGRGSFADVYLGEHLHLNTQAAIKVLNTYFTSEDKDRFYAEARMIARLTHPHIVRILDFDVDDGFPFLIMEYAPNGTLLQRHPKGTSVPLDIVVSNIKQVAAALQYIHTQKLIHRDIKPESMLLGHNDEVLLAEFGTAIIAQSTRSAQVQQPLGVAESVIYMAPEQLMGKPRPASDQYALAVVAYEWLSGTPPFSGSIPQIANQHLSAIPPAIHTNGVTISSAVEHAIRKALAKEPKQRFAHVRDFATALEEAFEAETTGSTLFFALSEHPAESGQGTPATRYLPSGTVTFLFTEIEGSTHLFQQLGGNYASVLGECRQLLRTVFLEWNGHMVDTQGDVFCIAFARATDAVLAAVEVQRVLDSHSWSEGVAVRVRMGLHTGEPTLTSEGYVGLDVHRAARIMNAGHGGQVLLSQTTSNLVEQDLPDDVILRDLGEHHLKDLARPKRLFQLVIAGLPMDFPSLKTLDIYPNNLPVQLTPFIGREQEVTTVCDLLRREDVRLLALTGPGGTGKTRLSLQVAAELSDLFSDGAFFVNLAPINDPALAMSTIAETLSIREIANQSILERLKEYLQQKQMLLLLDNFEQVVNAAVQAVDLLVACPQLKVMLTSREVPHVRARHEFAVPPLPLPDLKQLPDLAVLSHYAAIALFISRAQAVKPDFQMTATNARAVAEICARLDGLPLAIELAAARVKLLQPQALLARMGQRLAILTSTSGDVPARQQTLLNTIAWSCDLLEAGEQQLFRRLSVFVDGCTLKAVEAVCVVLGDYTRTLLDEVASLVDKSLLQQSELEGEEPRLVMLETIREYGLECLRESGEAEHIHRAHALYYLAMAEEMEPKYWDAQAIATLDTLEREFENLRASLNWLAESGEIELALRLSSALWWFWYARGHLSEGRQWLELLLSSSEREGAPVRAMALSIVGWFAYQEQDVVRAETLLNEGLRVFRQHGEKRDCTLALYRLGLVAWAKGNYPSTQALAEEALSFYNELGDKRGIADTHLLLSHALSEQGEYASALKLAEQATTIYKEIGDQWAITNSLIGLASVVLLQGEALKARTLAEESLAISIGSGYVGGIAFSLEQLGVIVATQGEPTWAVLLWGAADALREIISAPLPLLERAGYERTVSAARSQLGDTSFATLWAEGRTMTPEQVLAAQTSVMIPDEEPAVAPVPNVSKPPSPRGYPDDLTTREVEVLRLLAQGWTDAQIADELVISPRTVNHHLTSIYRKIQVTTRSAATRYAVDQHLV